MKRAVDNEESASVGAYENNACKQEGSPQEKDDAKADSTEVAPSVDVGQSKKQKKKNKGDEPMSARRITKNVWLISVVFLLLFTAYGGLSSLQSSLHLQEGMGVITQSVLYGTMTLSCLFLPTIVIRKVGHKWTLAVSMIGYILWMAANGYAVWGTMVPASMIVGLCASTLWTSQCAYFTIVGKRYAELTGEKDEAVIGKFFGIMFMMFQLNKIVGSIISSTVLQQGPANRTEVPEDVLDLCGARDCPWNNVTNTNFEKPPSYIVWTLVGVYIGCALIGLAIQIFLVDPLPKCWVEKPNISLKREVRDSLLATIKHMRHKKMLLLIPLTIYSGFEQTLNGAEYNKSFITCALGMWMIGYVSIPAGLVNALVSFSGGRLLKFTGRIPLFTTAMVVDLAMIITILLWRPNPSQLAVFFILPLFWGISDGVWQAQINAFYGAIFLNESEAAFSNYRLWESVGFTVGFAYSNFLCTSTKIYITLSFLVVGMILYYIIEADIRSVKAGHSSADPKDEKEKTAPMVVEYSPTTTSSSGSYEAGTRL